MADQHADLPTRSGNLCRCTGYRAIADAAFRRALSRGGLPGQACGASLRNPREAIRHRGEPYRWTSDGWAATPQVLRSPHAHARILRIGRERAASAAGRRRVFTGRLPRRLSAAPPTRITGRPEPPMCSTKWSAFVGQRVRGCRGDRGRSGSRLPLLDVQYEILPAVFDPEAAMRRRRRCCARRGLPPTAMSMPISTERSAALRKVRRRRCRA